MELLISIIKWVPQQRDLSAQRRSIHNVLAWIDSLGGMEVMLQQMKLCGSGHIVQSWLSCQRCQPLSCEQVFTFVTPHTLQQLADRCAIVPRHAAALLAAYLPLMVNGLSDSGELTPEATTALLKAGRDALSHLSPL